MGDLLYEMSRLWLGNFSLVIIQDTLFLLLIFILLILSRNSSARLSYLICLIGIIKLIIPPFVPFKNSGGLTGLYLPFTALKDNSLENSGEAVLLSENPLMVNESGFNWPEVIFIIWIIGAMIYLMIPMIRVLRLTFSLRFAQRLPSTSYSKYLQLGKIEVYLSHRIPMPMTIVFFPNRIFVPNAWYDWDERCRKIVLKHEEIHLQNHDNLIQLFQVFAQAIFFFHPLVYVLNKKMNLYREMACDDRAVRIGMSTRLDYSKCLTRIAERAIGTPTIWQTTSAFINQKCDLSDRIKYQMREVKMFGISKKIIKVLMVLHLTLIPVFSWYVGSADAEPITMEEIYQDLIEIRIYNEGDIRIDGKKVKTDEFEEELAKIAEEYDDPVIDLEFNEDIGMPLVFKVQRTLRDMNLLNVRYADDEDRVLNLHLPNTASEEQLQKIASSDILTLNIISTGQIQTNDITVDITELEKLLRDSHAENEYLIVSIKAENDVIYKDFIIVLDEVRKSQSKRVLIHDNID